MNADRSVDKASREALPARLLPADFDELPNWTGDDHAAALSCFRISARRMAERPYTTKALGISSPALVRAAEAALALPANPAAGDARAFFESRFTPLLVEPLGPGGHVTAYYEPEVPASPVETGRFRHPVLARPDDLVAVDDTNRPDGWDESFVFARQTPQGLTEYWDRGAIETGALAGRGLELFWLEDPVDLFFIHIQGSARLVLPDGSIRRIAYAAKTGHPFTAIGRLLIERGELPAEGMSMQSIRGWLKSRPQEALSLMRQNRSYIFFREVTVPAPDLGPIGAASVQLTPGRSLAVDHRLHTFGTPIFVAVEGALPGLRQHWNRLMIAQDTGSAIVGPARGDLFIGSGSEAGEIAGRISLPARFFVLAPNEDGVQR